MPAKPLRTVYANLSIYGMDSSAQGQELPKSYLASWLQNQDSSGTPHLKSKGSSIQQTFIQCILGSWHRGQKEEHWTES